LKPDLSREAAFVGGLVCGVDEAGRGPWAGPVSAGAVILDPARVPAGLNDSKKLTPKARERLEGEILVSAIAWVMLGLALGWSETGRVLRVDPARLAMVGLLVAGLTGWAPMLWGRTFFEQFFWHGSVPFLGEIHVGTPLAFDAGVFLVVVGIAVKMIMVLGRSTSGMRAFPRVEADRYFSTLEEPIEGPAVVPKGQGGPDAG